jgi:hypothetical protein
MVGLEVHERLVMVERFHVRTSSLVWIMLKIFLYGMNIKVLVIIGGSSLEGMNSIWSWLRVHMNLTLAAASMNSLFTSLSLFPMMIDCLLLLVVVTVTMPQVLHFLLT